jgi:hypothetical protein
MQRILMCVFFILAGAPCIAGSGEHTVMLTAEYREDALDYEEESRSFYREKARVLFGEKSELNFTAVQRERDGARLCTWSLLFNGPRPGPGLLAGHFHASFGSGLLLGTRAAFNPDPFARKEHMDGARRYSPATGGNPFFAFFGAAAWWGARMNSLEFTASAFHSAAPRYVSNTETESGFISSGIPTLEGSLERSNGKTDPVRLITSGAIISTAFSDSIFFSAFALRSAVEGETGERLCFSSASRDGNAYGVSAVKGAGAHLMYRDRFITLFIEHDRSFIEIQSAAQWREKTAGDATLWGAKTRLPGLSLSITRIKRAEDYFAPYGATIGEDHSGEGWFADAEARPWSFFTASAKASLESKSVPSAQDHSLPSTARQSVSVRVRPSGVFETDMSGRFLQRDRDGAGETRSQFHAIMRVTCSKNLRIDARSTLQRKDGASRAWESGLALYAKLFGAFRCAISASHVRAGEENPLYMSVLPLQGSSITGAFVREDASIYAARLSYRAGVLSLSSRAAFHCYGGDRYGRSLEMFAKGSW